VDARLHRKAAAYTRNNSYATFRGVRPLNDQSKRLSLPWAARLSPTCLWCHRSGATIEIVKRYATGAMSVGSI
jgi:hypothetical protein